MDINNTQGTAKKLNELAGNLNTVARTTIWGLFLTSALSGGSLTIYGVVDSAGAAVSWVISNGSSGYQAPPPGAVHTGGSNLTYAYASASDQGKAVIAYA